MTYEEDAIREQAQKIVDQQLEADRQRAIFYDIIQHPKLNPDDLRRTMLLNLTTKPNVNKRQLGLAWMQTNPWQWEGYNPDECEKVAEAHQIGEDA